MSKFLKVGFIALLFLMMLSCTDSSTTTRNYRIINGTTHAVELRFYKATLANQERSFVFKEEIEGEGLILERILKTYALETNSPIEAYKADSIALVFNNERLEGHTFSNPAGNSMLTNYKRNGEQFTYTITEENYSNATPCDGPCN